ncbi:hypothetical protein GCM10027259_13590 [Micromonospora palomenae]
MTLAWASQVVAAHAPTACACPAECHGAERLAAAADSEGGLMGYDFEWVDLPEPAATARSRYQTCSDLGGLCVHAPPCWEEY